MLAKTERQIKEIEYIRNLSHSFTAKELAEYFGVSRTTAQLDIDELKEAGYKIVGKSGNAGGYVLLDDTGKVDYFLDGIQVEVWNNIFNRCSASERAVMEYVLAIAEQNSKNNLKD